MLRVLTSVAARRRGVTWCHACSNIPASRPFAFKFGCNPPKVIRGLEVGVKSMREGGQRLIHIPSYMAYGPDGAKKIPKNADLTFDVELVAIGSRQC